MPLPLVLLALAALPPVQDTAPGRDDDAWPVRPDEAVLVFRDAFAPVRAFERRGAEPLFDYALERHGLARIDGAGALLLGHGTARAPRQDAALIELLGRGRGFSLQAWVTPAASTPEGEEPILAYGPADDDTAPPNLVLAQRGRTLVARVRSRDGAVEVAAESLAPGRPRHVGLTVEPSGRLALHVDGRERARTGGPPLDLASWTPGPLVLGGGSRTRAGWAGALEGLALHAAALRPEEVAASARAYARRVEARSVPHLTRLEGRLVGRSHVPTPDEVAPYPEALAVFEYEVLRVLEGFYLPGRVRVAHWVVLGGTPLATGVREYGDVVELRVVAFAANPQLETVNLSDTLEFDFDLELHFDVDAPRPAD